MTARVLVLVVVGCNQVYGLEQTQLVPGADSDGDTVRDLDDNCPTIANAMQTDEDGDLIGDACDNCPLIANAQQQAIGDTDAVGDHCDPHPSHDGDCLVVFDTFADASAFAASWRVVSNESAPRVSPTEGAVLLQPTPGMGGIAIVALDGAGAPLTGRHDVQVLGHGKITNKTAGAAAVSNLTTVADGYRCQLVYEDATKYFALALRRPSTEVSPGGQLSATPIGEPMLLRLVSETFTQGFSLECRGDYGLAAGASLGSQVAELPDGSPGVLAIYDPLTVEGVAIYRYQPGVACPPPIIR